MTEALEKQNEMGTGTSLAAMVDKLGPQIARALPRHLTPDRMARVVLTALRTTKNLAKCDQVSFAGCIMNLAQIGLEPNTPLGHAWLIPRRNKAGGYECTTIIGYQGYLELARRSGLTSAPYAHVVREGDEFVYELGLERKLIHRPKAGNATAPITHAYAVAPIAGGDPVFVVLDASEIEVRRKRGASGNNYSTPWDTDYTAMALKSAVRALWPWLPKSAEMALAASLDDDTDRRLDADDGRTVVRSGSFLAAVQAPQSLPAETVDTQTGEVFSDPTPEEAAEIERLSRNDR